MMCRKVDSIMPYSGGNAPEDVFLAPKSCSGYVTLVNTGDSDTNNCRVLKTVIKDRVRIILYTIKPIKEGE